MERIMIQGAMITISTDMTQCIQFVEHDPQRDAGKDFLFISKTLNDGYVLHLGSTAKMIMRLLIFCFV